MEKVYDYGRESGCDIATVVTMNFQGAKDFYEHLEYECDLKALAILMADVVSF